MKMWLSRTEIKLHHFAGITISKSGTQMCCKLLRELMQISTFCGYSLKFSPQNLGGMVLFGSISKQSAKVFLVKIFFPPICKSFLPQKSPTTQYVH